MKDKKKMKNKFLIICKYIIVFMFLSPFIITAVFGCIFDLLIEWIKTDDKSIIDIYKQMTEDIKEVYSNEKRSKK